MTIVVGHVPNLFGDAALAAAIDESIRRQDELLIVNSSTGAAVMDPALDTPESLEGLHSRVRERGVSATVRQVSDAKSPADEILRAVEDVDAALLVIGIRRRSAVGKLLLGSTAQELLLRCPCPVLAVKPHIS